MQRFRTIVKNRIPYLVWQAGLLGNRQKLVKLVSGERLIMRHRSANDYNAAYEIFLSNVYEPPFPLPSVSRITDLGGNVGFASIQFARRFPGCHIDLFEPHPVHVGQAQLNLAANSLTARVTVHPQAAGAANKTVFLVSNGTMSKVISEPLRNSIPVQIIDWLAFAQNKSFDLLKIDIEGGEYDIIFDRRFESLHIPYILLEWHVADGESRPNISDRLHSIGYEVHGGAEHTIPGLRFGMIYCRHRFTI